MHLFDGRLKSSWTQIEHLGQKFATRSQSTLIKLSVSPDEAPPLSASRPLLLPCSVAWQWRAERVLR